jgi:hypothetical protein
MGKTRNTEAYAFSIKVITADEIVYIELNTPRASKFLVIKNRKSLRASAIFDYLLGHPVIKGNLI